MRVFVVVGLVFFHSARVFDTGEFYIKNEPTSEIIDAVIGFAVMWAMPLLFVIAGIGIWHSLGTRRPRAFAAERTKRLFVPLVFGTLIVVPPQVWYQIRAETGSWPDYLSFYRDFLDVEVNLAGFPFVVRPAPATDLFEYGQLWFLVLLFVWSLLLLPFFVAVRRWHVVERVVDRHGVWWPITAFVVILTVISATLPLRPEVALWNPWAYLAFVAYGFVFASDRRIGHRLGQVRWWVLATGLLGFGVFAAVHIIRSDVTGADPVADYDAISVVFRVAFALGGWCLVASILSFAGRRRGGPPQREPGTGPRRTLWARLAGVSNEAVLPVYVLHQTVIVAIAFLVVSWPIAWGLKYVLLATSALIVTLALFQVVRWTSVTRFLFGMKTSARPDSNDTI
jgi:hypothetical protein